MLFVALSSSYIVRSASGDDWHPIVMPKVLWLSTAVILISSFTMEISRRSLKALNDAGYGRWLAITLILGLGFLVSQLMAWRQLVRQGVYMSSNPHSSFFYLFTAAHGLHLFGGILALGYLVLRTTRKRDTVEGELKRLGAADWLRVCARFERLADAVQILAEHRFFFGHDAGLVVVKLDDGHGGFCFSARETLDRAKMDPGDGAAGRDFYSAALV